MSSKRSSTERTWALQSASIDESVKSESAFEAMQSLRDRPVEDFGLVVLAIPDGDESAMEIAATSRLFDHWGRHIDAELAREAAREEGLLT